MKAVILAGGLGTRISEETHLRPKPMIEIGGKPIIWHIMKTYSHHGIRDFVICCGYKGYMIKEYFSNYLLHNADVTVDLKSNQLNIHRSNSETWTITMVDTGEQTMTGGRLQIASRYLQNEENFCFTYGDGVSDVNISKLIKFHLSHQKWATLTATRPPGRFGALSLNENKITSFKEKPRGDGNWINGGFFVLNRRVFDLLTGPDCVWEERPMETLVAAGQFHAFLHEGFWQPMDTFRDKALLEELWQKGDAPWKVWT